MKKVDFQCLMEQEGSDRLGALASEAARHVHGQGWLLATAESCTGGLLSHTLTNMDGSSAWFHGGVVCYSNALKTGLLGVDQALLDEHGAVSEAVVLAMARGALRLPGMPDMPDMPGMPADMPGMPEGRGVSVAISGIAGPTGGTREKPVGTVWMAWAWPGGERAEQFLFRGSRPAVKAQSAAGALFGLATFTR